MHGAGGGGRGHREALKEYTQARVPLDWAMTQNKLTQCLALLDKRRKT
jgi:hypothetical protein